MTLEWSVNWMANIKMCLKYVHLLGKSITATTGNNEKHRKLNAATHPTLCQVPLLHWKQSCCSDTIQHQQERHKAGQKLHADKIVEVKVRRKVSRRSEAGNFEDLVAPSAE